MYSEAPDGYAPGDPYVLREGSDVILVATGLMVSAALEAADALAADGLSATVIDVHTLKPFSAETIASLVARHPLAVVVEEHNTEGGLGTMVAEALAEAGARVPLVKHGVPDEISALSGAAQHRYAYYGLDGPGVTTVARRAVERSATDWWAQPRGPFWTAADRHGVHRRALEHPRTR